MSFDAEMYARIRDGCIRSAAEVVPAVYELVQPETVIDVGGGEGWWGKEFFKRGCDVVVLDDEGHEAEDLRPPGGGTFRREWANLTTLDDVDVPIPPAGRYDLAVCLEVAEHIDEQYADALVGYLCGLAPVVLWSAAIPNQGGHGHVNEQWPEYWTVLFERRSFYAWDCLRPRFWANETVEPWYRQNLLLMLGDFAPVDTRNVAEIPSASGLPLPLVHPDIYGWRVAERDDYLRLLQETE